MPEHVELVPSENHKPDADWASHEALKLVECSIIAHIRKERFTELGLSDISRKCRRVQVVVFY